MYKHNSGSQRKKEAYTIGYLDLEEPHLRDEWNLPQIFFLGHYFSLSKETEEGYVLAFG